MFRRQFLIVITLLGVGIGMVLHAESVSAQPNAAEQDDALYSQKVIERLDVQALPTGRHHFFFKAGMQANGQPFLVPVIVLRGTEPGKRLTLTAAVHGDELNGIAVIHDLLNSLNPADLRGTVIAVPGVNQPGLLERSRLFEAGSGLHDPNRIFPGRRKGGNAAERYIGKVWHNLLKENTDLAIDLHTQTTGSRYPLFVFADFRNDTARHMAYALMPDLIKNDSGQKGALETTYLKASIPAVTFEIGGAVVFEQKLISRAVAGIKNVMVVEGFLAGRRIVPDIRPFVGSSYTNVQTEEPGTALLKVGLLDRVEKGQLLAVVLDPFGDEVRRYHAPHAGRILAVATDPIREEGAMLVRILR